MAIPVEPKPRQARPLRLGRILLGVAPWLGLAATTALLARRRGSEAAPGPAPVPAAPPALQAGLSERGTASPATFEADEPGRGRLASSPRHIPWAGWGDILWRTWREIGADRLPAVAGGITFYVLLAIFPAVGVFVSLYGLVADIDQVSRHLDQLALFLPQEVLQVLGDQMVRLTIQKHASLSAAFAISLILSLWSANAGMQALFDGLNVAYDENERRNFLVKRATALGFTAATLLFIMAVTAVLVAAPSVLEDLGGDTDIDWLIPLRWLVLLLLAAAYFAVLYRFGPSRELARWRWVIAGAVIAALVWVAGSLGFSWFVNNIAHYNLTYGSLGTVIGLMMWIWFSAMVVLLGAELNAEIEHQTAIDSTTGAPLPMGRRGAAVADSVGLRFLGVKALVAPLWRLAAGLGGRRRGPPI